MRPEDGGDKQRTWNNPARILAELLSWNPNFKPHFLHWKTNRNRRSHDGGWNQTRPTTRRRYSWSHRYSRYNRLQSVHRYGVRFVPYLKNKKFLGSSENFVRTSVEQRERRSRSTITYKHEFSFRRARSRG